MGVTNFDTVAADFVGNLIGNLTGNITGNQTESLSAVAGTTVATREGGAKLPNSGISTISSTGGQKNYTLDAPVAGIHKTIVCTAGSTANKCVVLCSTGVTFDGANTEATFDAAGEFLDLIGLSATQWLVKVNGGSVSLGTT